MVDRTIIHNFSAEQERKFFTQTLAAVSLPLKIHKAKYEVAKIVQNPWHIHHMIYYKKKSQSKNTISKHQEYRPIAILEKSSEIRQAKSLISLMAFRARAGWKTPRLTGIRSRHKRMLICGYLSRMQRDQPRHDECILRLSVKRDVRRFFDDIPDTRPISRPR